MYVIASNGTIHAQGCVHANRVKTLSGGHASPAAARKVAKEDFTRVSVAKCAADQFRSDVGTAPKPRTVKVALYVVVEVNVDALEAEYGQPFTNAEAREDAWQSMFNAATTAAYPAERNAQILPEVISTNRRA